MARTWGYDDFKGYGVGIRKPVSRKSWPGGRIGGDMARIAAMPTGTWTRDPLRYNQVYGLYNEGNAGYQGYNWIYSADSGATYQIDYYRDYPKAQWIFEKPDEWDKKYPNRRNDDIVRDGDYFLIKNAYFNEGYLTDNEGDFDYLECMDNEMMIW